MTILREVADFAAEVRIEDVPEEVVETLRLHLCDTLLAGFAGGRGREVEAIVKTVQGLCTNGPVPALGTALTASAPVAALVGCVAVRCTEIDDIHMESCVTPGAVVVPTALSMAHVVPGVDANQLLAALLVGYEVMTRFGRAANGPFVLYRGVWPTYFASSLAAAATSARILGLSTEETAHALGAAVTLTNGTSAKIAGLSSRWLTLGCSVQSAIVASAAAGRGYRGALRALDGPGTELNGVRIDTAKLIQDLGAEYETLKLSIKPYCAAKQTTSAIQAFVNILNRRSVDPNNMEQVIVAVPSYYSEMIDHPDLPGDAIGSIVSIQYQLALAAFHPDELTDTARHPIHDDASFVGLMSKVVVEVDETLKGYFPELWPARVVVRTADHTYSEEVHEVKGDYLNPFAWEDEIKKMTAVLSETTSIGLVTKLATVCRGLGRTTTVNDLLCHIGA